jgi:hypothetical protein
MVQSKRKLKIVLWVLLSAVVLGLLLWGSICILLQNCAWSYARAVSHQEEALRQQVISTAESWLGCNESDGSHKAIIDLYNSHTPLARGYTVTYQDSWCATFCSAVAIQLELTHIIPTECGCEKQIGLFSDMGRWVEDDGYVPLPGDLIYYSSLDSGLGDCDAWSDHVGIVVGTWGPFIKVIEGNYENKVQYRILPVNSNGIRGYGIPDYESIA